MVLSVEVLTALAVLTLVWLGALTIWVFKIASHYGRLVGKTGKTDLRGILESLLSHDVEVREHLAQIRQKIAEVERQGQWHIQKTGVVRFNPFAETGGDQSFALALLDGQDSGIVVLSLHGREATRVYVKPVKNGKSRYELSGEEKQAIAQAQKQ